MTENKNSWLCDNCGNVCHRTVAIKIDHCDSCGAELTSTIISMNIRSPKVIAAVLLILGFLIYGGYTLYHAVK